MKQQPVFKVIGYYVNIITIREPSERDWPKIEPNNLEIYMISYIIGRKENYFLDLCGNYSMTSALENASTWSDADSKSLWYFKHELETTTGQSWEVYEVRNGEVTEAIEESEDARTFYMTLTNTLENCEKNQLVEKRCFNYKKDKLMRTWSINLIIDGKSKYIPVAECEDKKFYRYKQALSKPVMYDNMWRW